MDVAVSAYEFVTTGGVGRYTWEVAADLARRGHRVDVYAPGDAAPSPPGVRRRRLGPGRPPNSVVGAAELMTFGARVAPRLWCGRRRAVYGPVGAVLVPGVMTAHSVHTAWVRDRQRAGGAPPNPFDRGLMALERVAFRLPYVRRTAVSPLCADDAAECLGVARASIVVVPPAVDAQRFAPRSTEEREAARTSFGLRDGQFVVGVAANFAFERKRVAALIEAAGTADGTLLVAGASDRRSSYYRQLAEQNRSDVRFLGPLGDMRAFYCALDVFALPSVNEAYGMAAHEAMACGVATVVSDRCGIAGLLEPNVDALVVGHRHVDELVDVLERLRDDDMRRGVARAGATWARQRSWSDVGAGIEALLRE